MQLSTYMYRYSTSHLNSGLYDATRRAADRITKFRLSATPTGVDALGLDPNFLAMLDYICMIIFTI